MTVLIRAAVAKNTSDAEDTLVFSLLVGVFLVGINIAKLTTMT